jgi:hypothetical protein
VLVPTWALASLAAAVLAHALIGSFGAWFGADADAYDARVHGAVVPAVTLALALLAGAFLRVAAGVAAHRERRDPIELLARRFGVMRPAWPVAAVACGALAALIAMEFSEQLVAVGHVQGVADALGGTPALGLAILLCTSIAVTLAGLRTAHALVAATRVLIESVVRAIVQRPDYSAGPPAPRAAQRRPAGRRAALLARCRGLRAPPLVT